MARLNPPSSTAVVDVPDALVEKYEAQGWTAEKSSTKEQAPRRRAAEKSD